MNTLSIPKYISTFDLEQARLGQAMQTLKLELNSKSEKTPADLQNLVALEDPRLLKQVLSNIRDESINAEWALKNIFEDTIMDTYENSKNVKEIYLRFLKILLKR